jgi:hypothetical protein
MQIPPRHSAVLRLSAEVGQTIEIVVTVDTDVDLALADPTGRVVVGPQRISGTYTIEQVSSASGDWVLTLDNSFSLFSNKRVTVEYRVSSGQ